MESRVAELQLATQLATRVSDFSMVQPFKELCFGSGQKYTFCHRRNVRVRSKRKNEVHELCRASRKAGWCISANAQQFFRYCFCSNDHELALVSMMIRVPFCFGCCEGMQGLLVGGTKLMGLFISGSENLVWTIMNVDFHPISVGVPIADLPLGPFPRRPAVCQDIGLCA